jgi:hypothetical protein
MNVPAAIVIPASELFLRKFRLCISFYVVLFHIYDHLNVNKLSAEFFVSVNKLYPYKSVLSSQFNPRYGLHLTGRLFIRTGEDGQLVRIKESDPFLK